MKVYVIIWYSWPDYELIGVVTDKEAAKKWISEQSCPEGYYIEECELNMIKEDIDNFHSKLVKVGDAKLM